MKCVKCSKPMKIIYDENYLFSYEKDNENKKNKFPKIVRVKMFFTHECLNCGIKIKNIDIKSYYSELEI